MASLPFLVSTTNGGPAAPPPPPPPPPPEMDEISTGGGADSGRNALLASLNQGDNVTKGKHTQHSKRHILGERNLSIVPNK